MKLADPKQNEGRKLEWIGVSVCVALYFLLRVWNLPNTLISDKFDEGVYLSLMLGAASGKGALYRDYILCHPPGVLWAGIWLWPRVHGSITALRLIYIFFCALVLPPVYVIARRYYGVRAALLTLFLLCTSPGLANWLGREVYLDPPLNVPLYAALWLLLCHPRSRLLNVITAGGLIGVSYCIKETALPAAVAVCVALWSAARGQGRGDREPGTGNKEEEISGITCPLSPVPSSLWLWFGVAFLAAFVLTLGALCRIPNYFHDTFTLNAGDARDWGLRLHELVTGFFALPLLLTFGAAGIWLMAWHGRGRHERLLGIYALTMTLLMFLIPKGFYWRYLTAALPIYCLATVVWWQRFLAAPRSRAARNTARGLLVLFSLVHLVSLILYRTHESVNPPAYAQALKLLRASPDPLFTLDPLWSAASGHPLTPPTQQLIKVTVNLPVTDAEADSALSACPTVLLDRTSLRWLPPATLTAIHTRYRTLFRYGRPGQSHYVEILRNEPP